MCVFSYVTTCVKVRGQLKGGSSLPSLCGSKDLVSSLSGLGSSAHNGYVGLSSFSLVFASCLSLLQFSSLIVSKLGSLHILDVSAIVSLAGFLSRKPCIQTVYHAQTSAS